MSDYLERLIAKARGDDLWKDVGGPPPRTEKNSVNADGFDKMSWAWITDSIPVLNQQVDDLGEDFPTSPAAYEDLFHLMHKADPRATPEPLLLDEYKPQAAMMQMIGKSDELGHLRHETVLDEYNTAYAMLTMRDKMRLAFENMQEAIENAEAARDALAAALQQAQDALASGDGDAIMAAAEALEDALAQYGQAEAEGEKSAEEGAASIQGAADTAAQQIADERALLGGWGIGPGELKRMSFEERRALSEKLHKSRMAKFAKMIGAQRMSNDAERRRSIRKAPVRVSGTRLGRDLTKLIPDEQLRLAIPELEEDFWLRFAKNRLRLKRWDDPPKLDRGPKIVVCDESGSMGAAVDSEGNTREMWSKAVALSVCDAARRDKCDFFYIGFASMGETWCIDFPKGQTPIEKVTEFTEHFFCGGTHYERPLRQAMAIVEDYIERHQPLPDIVFITDDECRVSDEFIAEWREVRERTQAHVYGIQIGGTGQYSTMEKLTDRQLDFDSINTAELFRSL